MTEKNPQAIVFSMRPDGGIGRHTGLKIPVVPEEKKEADQWFLSKSPFFISFCNSSHSAHSAQASPSTQIPARKCLHSVYTASPTTPVSQFGVGFCLSKSRASLLVPLFGKFSQALNHFNKENFKSAGRVIRPAFCRPRTLARV